jgi:hypothetical protein
MPLVKELDSLFSTAINRMQFTSYNQIKVTITKEFPLLTSLISIKYYPKARNIKRWVWWATLKWYFCEPFATFAGYIFFIKNKKWVGFY